MAKKKAKRSINYKKLDSSGLMKVIKNKASTREQRSMAAKEMWSRRTPTQRKAMGQKVLASRKERQAKESLAIPPALTNNFSVGPDTLSFKTVDRTTKKLSIRDELDLIIMRLLEMKLAL